MRMITPMNMMGTTADDDNGDDGDDNDDVRNVLTMTTTMVVVAGSLVEKRLMMEFQLSNDLGLTDASCLDLELLIEINDWLINNVEINNAFF